MADVTRAEARGALDSSGRAAVEALSDAIGGIAGILPVEEVLQLIVDRVRGLVGAHYAALGILAEDREHIERFITSGITPEQRRLLGPPPEGHGLLGLIIKEGRSLRIPNIATHPASYGFPPNHPMMTSLLGVPVRLKNRVIGDLYLTDKVGAPEFTDDACYIGISGSDCAGCLMPTARSTTASRIPAAADCRAETARIMTTFDPA